MLHVGVQLEFEAVHEVLSATVMELKRNKDKILCPGPKDDVDNIKVGRLCMEALDILGLILGVCVCASQEIICKSLKIDK